MNRIKPENIFSKNTIVNKRLIQNLIARSGVKEGDTVYDIGAGSGVISRALLDAGARVVGIEKDPKKGHICRELLAEEDRFELYIIDFLQMKFPPEGSYKVFSNIPFLHTAKFLKKLLNNSNPPTECYLMLQKEAAEKYAGTHEETLQSLLLKPVFWVEIVHHFERKDFFPVPGVDIVLIQFEKRRFQLVSDEYYPLYRDFVVFCREEPERTVRSSLMRLFTWNQFRQLSNLVDIDHRRKPIDLSFYQYLAIFQFYLECYQRNQVVSVTGAENAYRRKPGRRMQKTRKSS